MAGNIRHRSVGNKLDSRAEYEADNSHVDPSGDDFIPSRSATFVVAASDAFTKSRYGADYVCDGTADDVQIQAAIAALPASGGRVLLTEGTFNTNDTIILDDNVTLEGQGDSTIVTPTTDGFPAAGNNERSVIWGESKDNCQVKNLQVDGNKGTIADLIGICVDGASGSESTNILFQNILVHDTGESGLHFRYVQYSTIRNIRAYNIGVASEDVSHGVYVFRSDYCNVAGIICWDITDQSGVKISTDTHINVSDVVVYNAARALTVGGTTTTGINIKNVVSDTCNTGLFLGNDAYHVNIHNYEVTGADASAAIQIKGTSSDITLSDLQIHDNTVDGLLLQDTDHAIVNGGTFKNNTDEGIRLNNATYCTIIGAACYDDQDTKTQLYGIREAGTSDYNTFIGCDVRGNATANIVPSGDNTRIISSPGWASGEYLVYTGELTAGNANDFAFAWQNPYDQRQITIDKVIIEVTVAGGTAGSVLDVDCVASATTTDDHILDGIDLNAAYIYDSRVAADAGANALGIPIKLDKAGDTTDWVTGKILVENAASLEGSYHIFYLPRRKAIS